MMVFWKVSLDKRSRVISCRVFLVSFQETSSQAGFCNLPFKSTTKTIRGNEPATREVRRDRTEWWTNGMTLNKKKCVKYVISLHQMLCHQVYSSTMSMLIVTVSPLYLTLVSECIANGIRDVVNWVKETSDCCFNLKDTLEEENFCLSFKIWTVFAVRYYRAAWCKWKRYTQ